MSEKGILFNGAMVRAIMAGKKTQTRRIMTPQPGCNASLYKIGPVDDAIFTDGTVAYPKYQKEDHLYVRETWQEITVDMGLGIHDYYYYRATDKMGKNYNNWRPSIHMPKCAARLWLDVIRVWPEIVADVSEEDAIKEGFDSKKAFLDTMVKIYGNCLKKWCWATEFKRVEVHHES